MQNGLSTEQAKTEALKAQNEAIKNIDKAYDKQEADRGSAFSGMKAGWQEISEQMTNYNEMAKQFTVDTYHKMSSALTDFVMTGKLNHKELASSILSDLSRMIIQQQIFNGLKAVGGGFANGGAFEGGTQAFADGGVVNHPTTFPMSGGRQGLMGEAGPEAIMPLTRDATGRLGVATVGGGGGSTSNVYNITVNVQGNGKQSGAEQGEQISQAVMDKMKLVARGEIANAQRPGNALSRG